MPSTLDPNSACYIPFRRPTFGTPKQGICGSFRPSEDTDSVELPRFSIFAFYPYSKREDEGGKHIKAELHQMRLLAWFELFIHASVRYYWDWVWMDDNPCDHSCRDMLHSEGGRVYMME